mmetsp:Transcript_14186/g.26694  ORF Transcript_14186/g.26694 Transcript_14186/m.26694 type:complete len:191 (-) Transcript_14186:113-685(-)
MRLTKSSEEKLGALGNLAQRRAYDAKGTGVNWGDIIQFYFIWGVLSYALTEDECYKGSSLVILLSLFGMAVGDYQRIVNNYIWTLQVPMTTFELASLLKSIFPAYAWLVMTVFAYRHFKTFHSLNIQLVDLKTADQVTLTLINQVSSTLEDVTKKRKDDVIIGWFARLIIFLVLSSAFQFLVVTVTKSEK